MLWCNCTDFNFYPPTINIPTSMGFDGTFSSPCSNRSLLPSISKLSIMTALLGCLTEYGSWTFIFANYYKPFLLNPDLLLSYELLFSEERLKIGDCLSCMSFFLTSMFLKVLASFKAFLKMVRLATSSDEIEFAVLFFLFLIMV